MPTPLRSQLKKRRRNKTRKETQITIKPRAHKRIWSTKSKPLAKLEKPTNRLLQIRIQSRLSIHRPRATRRSISDGRIASTRTQNYLDKPQLSRSRESKKRDLEKRRRRQIKRLRLPRRSRRSSSVKEPLLSRKKKRLRRPERKPMLPRLLLRLRKRQKFKLPKLRLRLLQRRQRLLQFNRCHSWGPSP